MSLYSQLSNTEFERMALGFVNMSDGHARIPLDSYQTSIVSQAPKIFELFSSLDQLSVEAAFVDAFFTAVGQPSAVSDFPCFLSYSASSALSIAASVTSERASEVGLIEPVFDNIRHFLEREQLRLWAVPETHVSSPDSWPSLAALGSLWIVSPNNPTGFVLSRSEFEAIANACRRRDLLLVVDCTFRPHSVSARSWDMYEVLRVSGVDFIVIEDTGKTWGLADLKVGITVCSQSVHSAIHRHHDQLLLNVSPLVLILLAEIIRDFADRGYEETVGRHVAHNRSIAHGLLADTGLVHLGRCDVVPLELLGLPVGVDSERLWRECRDQGVHILPAHNYYWSSRPSPSLFRVPLARPSSDVTRACEVVRSVILG